MDTLTKQEYINSLLRDIESQSTRKDRASDAQELLVTDLEIIQKKTKRIRQVMESSKEFYTWYEIQKYNLSEFEKGIKKIHDESHKT